MNIRAEVFKLLDENPLLSANLICKILKISYQKRKGLIWKYCSNWRTSLKKQQGSKVKISYHKARGWVYVQSLGLKVDNALLHGWETTKMKNGGIVFRSSGYGRMVWFPTTGRVNLYILAPALRGRVYQLFCNGFSMTGLITDMTLLEKILGNIRLKSAHAVIPTTQRLPYMQVHVFKLSNGVVIKLGDKSHPNALEVEFCYPDFQEKSECLMAEIRDLLKGTNGPQRKDVDPNGPFYIQ